jgi:hypothetical protein
MNTKIFYGDEHPKALTYLEFGEINLEKQTKTVWEFQLHQKAYDWIMLPRYMNDILAYQDMLKVLGKVPDQAIFDIYDREVHHADDASTHLSKLSGLAVALDKSSDLSFYELGQTLFGCIDGMTFCQNLLKAKGIEFPSVQLKEVQWYGVDISEMFNRIAGVIHSDHHIVTMTDSALLPEAVDVFFAKGISLLYVVRDITQFFATIEKGECSIFDYSFSFADVVDTTIGSGKTVRYLPIEEFLQAYAGRGRKMFVNERNSRFIPETERLWVDCIYASEDVCAQYTAMDTRIRRELEERFAAIDNATRFLNGRQATQWVPVEEFIERIRAARTK